ncbi:hypothetical protein OG21DRAFT_1489059 [Imleria badia]|nr:hypothetical protein OG21DRAFT_1489059 [Imleria badia]
MCARSAERCEQYFNVAGMAILMYDYVITLEDEVQWVWGRGWDSTRFIFTVSRYLPFVGMVITVYAFLRSTSQPCSLGLEEDIILSLGITAAETLLAVRTYAFWEGNKRLLFCLFIYCCASIGVNVAIYTAPTQLIPEGVIPPGCVLISPRNTTFLYLSLFVFEMLILFLTVYKRLRSYREARISVVHTMYRDGVFYIVSIALVTLANILANSIFPSQFSDIFDLPQVALHSVLASRILFNLRKSSHRLQNLGGTPDATMLSGMAFKTPPGLQSMDPSCLDRGCGVPVTTIHVDVDIELARLKSHWDTS